MKFLLLALLAGCSTSTKAPVVIAPDTKPDEVVTLPSAQKITFSVKSTLPYLAETAKVAECVIHNEEFLKEVGAHKQFDYTKLTSPEVEKQLRTYKPIILSSYSKRFTKAIAYRNTGDNVVYFNTYKNPRGMKEMVNTCIHEWAHVQDFGHGGNSSVGKDNSVNYGVGLIAEKYVERCL